MTTDNAGQADNAVPTQDAAHAEPLAAKADRAAAASSTPVAAPGIVPVPTPPATLALGAAGLFVLCLIAFFPGLGGTFIWDDDFYVTNNPTLRSWGGLTDIWFNIGATPQYYPMTHTSFWIEWQLFGPNPLAFKITNLVLHTLSAMMLWVLLRRLQVPGAWVAAAVFAVHPLQVQSVAWITERKNVLSGAFFFASLIVYLRYSGLTPAPAAAADRSRSPLSLPDDPQRLYWLALVLFACAVLSKSVTAVLPAVVLLLTWWRRGRLAWKDFSPLLPFFAIGIALGLLTSYMEKWYVGARGPDWDYSTTLAGEVLSRVLIAGTVTWFYVYKLIAPLNLSFMYTRWDVSADKVLLYLFPIAALAVVIALWFARRRLGRGPVAAVFFFLGCLVPAMGFVDVWPMRYSFAANHFQYLAGIGLIVLAVAALARWMNGLVRRRVIAPALPAVLAGAVLLLLVGLSFSHARIYENPRTLWEDVLEKTGSMVVVESPSGTPQSRIEARSWIAANNYAALLLDSGGKDEGALKAAEAWTRQVLKIRPDHVEVHILRGRIAERRGNLDEAIGHFRKAIEQRRQNWLDYAEKHGLDPTRDYGLADDPVAHNAIAILLHRQGKLDEAIEHWEIITRMDPMDRYRMASLQAEAHTNIGVILTEQGKLEQAVQHYVDAMELDPHSIRTRTNLGSVLLKMNRLEQALEVWLDALRLEPRNPVIYNGLGVAYMKVGQLPEARGYLEQALALSPGNVEAMVNLGILEAAMGRYDTAIERFDAALKINPDYALARRYLEEAKQEKANPGSTSLSTRPSTAPATGPVEPAGPATAPAVK